MLILKGPGRAVMKLLMLWEPSGKFFNYFEGGAKGQAVFKDSGWGYAPKGLARSHKAHKGLIRPPRAS